MPEVISYPKNIHHEYYGPATFRAGLNAESGPLASARFDSVGRRLYSHVQHRLCPASVQLAGADVVARTEPIFIAPSPGLIEAFKVHVLVAPVGGTTGFTVDLQKSSGGGAYATVLTAVITVNDTNTNDRETETAAFADIDVAIGDAFRVVWALVGSGGSQAQGAIAQADFAIYG